MSEENKRRDRRRLLYWSITVLLLITNTITLWLLVREKNEVVRERVVKEQVIVEKDNLATDLAELQKEYELLETHDAALQQEIDEKKTRIAELMKQAEKHKNDAYIIAQLKKETKTLREIMIHYVHTIDSLNTLNQTLVAEKKTVLKQLGEEKQKQATLVKEKDELKSTIAKGSILTCFNITAKAVQFRRGGSKEVETSKARKAEKVKVSFTLGENKIARAGEKTVFVRIMTPDGKEMATSYDESNKFVFNGSVGYFAGKQSLHYANTEISGVTYCEGQGEYVPGNYMVEVVCDEVVIGSTTFRLD